MPASPLARLSDGNHRPTCIWKSRRGTAVLIAASIVSFFSLALLLGVESSRSIMGNKTVPAQVRSTASNRLAGRKLLGLDRIGDACTLSDVSILQGEANPQPDGIPTFTVQIFDSCTSAGCALRDIHVACGWWATAKLVNPSVFKRLAFDDCLVNDGQPLLPGQLLTFQYANSFQYPLTVKSVSCSCNS